MSDIRFRTWDKENGVMRKVKEISFSIGSIEVEPIEGSRESWELYAPISFEGSYELMQYTGLKDKNDIEIYEGDIITGQIVNNHYRKAVVKFINSSFCFVEFWQEGFLTMYEEKPLALDFYWNHVVIGNIYENKELLEED